MTNLVLLSGEREKKDLEGQRRLIEGLQELLVRAEAGDLKALCYGGIGADGQSISLGILHNGAIGLHEMVGLSQMLNDHLLKSCWD